ncbi:MAG: twitching motility protein PilJ, partial [Cellvibrionaceae bacterium]
MKVFSNPFQGRYWLTGFIAGILSFTGLTIYLSYLLIANVREDLDNQAKLSNLKTYTSGATFLTQKVVIGDIDAFDPLNRIISSMDSDINHLLSTNTSASEGMAVQYQQISSLWRSIRDNVNVLLASKATIDTLDQLRAQLNSAAVEANSLAVASVRNLNSRDPKGPQALSITRQATLISEMADELGLILDGTQIQSQNLDKIQSAFTAFEKGYNDILSGNSSIGLRAVTNNSIRNNLNIMSQSLQPYRDIENNLGESVETLKQAKDTERRIASSFENLSSTLMDMEQRMPVLSEAQFPKIYHILIVLAALIFCIIGLVLYLKMQSRRELNLEHEQSQRSQEAILRLLDELADLADGDLTISATVSEDFTGAIADSINFTIDQLRQLVSRINSTAVQVSQAAQSTQQTALHLADASNNQAQEIAGASAAINEMAVTIDQVSANASESSLVAAKSVSIANNGAKVVQNTIHGMDTIREQIQDTSKRIKRLGESSQEIGDIVSLINDIADQTNILALNAAIQASMAGDAGRGFAVVADEVQRLAERSAAATKQIETIVKTIQTDTNEAVISMEQTTSEVVNGARLAQDAGVALEEIEGVSANLAELIQNISNAANQQTSSASHIANTMNVIQEITSQTSAGTSDTAESIGDLANMALDLRQSVAGFTLPAGAAINEAIQTSNHEYEIPTLDTDNSLEAIFNDDKGSTAPIEMKELASELRVSQEDLEK